MPNEPLLTYVMSANYIGDGTNSIITWSAPINDVNAQYCPYTLSSLVNIQVQRVESTVNGSNQNAVPVGGDLLGYLPNPTVVGISGIQIDQTTLPTNEQVLAFNTATQTLEWSDAAGSGSTTVGGDLTGVVSDAVVTGIYNIPVNPTTPTNGEALIASLSDSGLQWVPTTLPTDVIDGISVDGSSTPINGSSLTYNSSYNLLEWKISSTVFNVKDFGAKGDGTTDDTAAILATIAAKEANLGGGTVYFPVGTYLVSSTIDFGQQPGTILGESSSNQSIYQGTWLKSTVSSGYAFTVGNNSGTIISVFITIKDIGFYTTVGGTTATGLCFRPTISVGITSTFIDNVNIVGFYDGFNPGGTENSSFNKLYINNCVNGIHINGVMGGGNIGACNANSFYDGNISSCSGIGILLEYVEQCSFHNMAIQGDGYGLYIKPLLVPSSYNTAVKEIDFYNCWFKQNGVSVILDAANESPSCTLVLHHIRFHNTHFGNLSTETWKFLRGISQSPFSFFQLELYSCYMQSVILSLPSWAQDCIIDHCDVLSFSDAGIRTIVNGSNTAINGVLNNKPNQLGYINVKDFGAKGDGTTDDTIAIQNTLNYAQRLQAPVVYFPQGVYIVSSKLNVISGSNGVSTPYSGGFHGIKLLGYNEGQGAGSDNFGSMLLWAGPTLKGTATLTPIGTVSYLGSGITGVNLGDMVEIWGCYNAQGNNGSYFVTGFSGGIPVLFNASTAVQYIGAATNIAPFVYPATFNLVSGQAANTNIAVTSTIGLQGVGNNISIGSKIVFSSQPGITYTISNIDIYYNGSWIQLSTQYTGPTNLTATATQPFDTCYWEKLDSILDIGCNFPYIDSLEFNCKDGYSISTFLSASSSNYPSNGGGILTGMVIKNCQFGNSYPYGTNPGIAYWGIRIATPRISLPTIIGGSGLLNVDGYAQVFATGNNDVTQVDNCWFSYIDRACIYTDILNTTAQGYNNTFTNCSAWSSGCFYRGITSVTVNALSGFSISGAAISIYFDYGSCSINDLKLQGCNLIVSDFGEDPVININNGSNWWAAYTETQGMQYININGFISIDTYGSTHPLNTWILAAKDSIVNIKGMDLNGGGNITHRQSSVIGKYVNYDSCYITQNGVGASNGKLYTGLPQYAYLGKIGPFNLSNGNNTVNFYCDGIYTALTLDTSLIKDPTKCSAKDVAYMWQQAIGTNPHVQLYAVEDNSLCYVKTYISYSQDNGLFYCINGTAINELGFTSNYGRPYNGNPAASTKTAELSHGLIQAITTGTSVKCKITNCIEITANGVDAKLNDLDCVLFNQYDISANQWSSTFNDQSTYTTAKSNQFGLACPGQLPCNNLGGTVQIFPSTSPTPVWFDRPEEDSQYTISFTFLGSDITTATTLTIQQQSKLGFTIAPVTSSTYAGQIYSWKMVRINPNSINNWDPVPVPSGDLTPNLFINPTMYCAVSNGSVLTDGYYNGSGAPIQYISSMREVLSGLDFVPATSYPVKLASDGSFPNGGNLPNNNSVLFGDWTEYNIHNGYLNFSNYNQIFSGDAFSIIFVTRAQNNPQQIFSINGITFSYISSLSGRTISFPTGTYSISESIINVITPGNVRDNKDCQTAYSQELGPWELIEIYKSPSIAPIMFVNGVQKTLTGSGTVYTAGPGAITIGSASGNWCLAWLMTCDGDVHAMSDLSAFRVSLMTKFGLI